MRLSPFLVALLALLLSAPSLHAQDASGDKRPLTHDDYDGWNSLRGQSLSRDGRWVAVTVSPQVGDGELIVRSTTGDTVYRHPRGTGARFTSDGRWVVFTISPSRADKLEADKKRLGGGGSSRGGRGGRGGSGRFGGRGSRGGSSSSSGPRSAMGIMSLADGSVEIVEKVKGFAVPSEGPAVVVYHLESSSSGSSNDKSADDKKEKSEAEKPEGAAEKKGEEPPAEGERPRRRRARGGRGGRGGRRGPGARGGRGRRPGARPESGGEAEKSDDEKEKSWRRDGTPLVVRDLSDRRFERIEGVTSYGITSKKAVLWFARNAKDDKSRVARGLHALDLATGERTTLVAGAATFGGVTTDREVTRMVFTSDRSDREAEKPRHEIWSWTVGDAKGARAIVSGKTDGFPEGRMIAAARGGGGGGGGRGGRRSFRGRFGGGGGGLSFSRDGSVLMFGTSELPKPEMPKLLDEESVKLDLWHWKDPLLQPMQAKRNRPGRINCAWHFDAGRLTVLSKRDTDSVSMLTPDGSWALLQDSAPYAQRVSWDATYADVYLVDTSSGGAKRVMSALRGRASSSPNGRTLAAFRDGHWYVVDVASGKERCLTKGMDVTFAREDWDTPQPARAYGIAGWSEDGAHVFIHDRFDLWSFPLDGGAPSCVTDGWGRQSKVALRYTSLDREERFLPVGQPILLAATNDETKATGYYTDTVGEPGAPKKIVMLDKAFSGLTKAKDAERMIFTLSTWSEFGDVWTATPGFSDMKKLTDANPQQRKISWGEAELVRWHSADGIPLKGYLVKPEGFDPKKKYPMMVYFYEKTSQNLHRYARPAPGTSPNAAYYVSNGYLWFQPDIVYRDGYPGESCLKCVASGVQSLIAKGFVDETAIGAAGHSWGGYQTAYLVTRTNLFKCVESGAPVSNMTSAYGGIRWSSGMSRAFQYERTQSRIGGSLWRYPMRYLENSPLFSADKVETPVLMLHNDEDGAVPWYQGIEFFCALRRLGKEVYMFNYVGQGHGLSRRADQRDWTKRMQQYFDHHLKGAPMPQWMAEGVAYKDREREKLEFMPPKHAVWPDKKEKKEEPAKAKASSSEASSEESGGAKKR